MSQAKPTSLQCTDYAKGRVALGMTISDAFLNAFPDSTMTGHSLNVKASEFDKLVEVQLRIEELYKEINDKADKDTLYTAQDALRELEEARAVALESAQPSAMVSASMGKAKIFGLLVDKAEVQEKSYIINVTEDEMKAIENETKLNDDC